MDGVRRTTTFGVKAPIFCRIARLFVSLGLLLLLAAANPFGLRTASDEESEDIVFRLIAPLYGGTEARDAITVLLVTDRDLELWGKEWPLQHTEQGDILYALHKVAPGPRALFYDFLFTDKREGSEYFSFALNSFEKSAPVLLSAMTTETPRTLGEHHGVLPALARNAELVAVQWAGHGRAYPLWVQAADGRWQMTPAMRLYQIYCAEQPDSCPADDFFHMPSADTDVPPALSLVWGGRPSRWQMDELPSRLHIIQETPCMEFGEGWQLVDSYVRLIYHGLAGNTAPIQPCFYHDTIPWRLAFDRNLGFVSPDIEEKISDRLVLMGGRLDAIQDEWPTPVHGKVPGVLHHAMALDNLITMGAAYLRYPPNIVSNMSLDDLIEIFLLLVILTKASQVRAVRETGTCWSIQALSSRKQPGCPRPYPHVAGHRHGGIRRRACVVHKQARRRARAVERRVSPDRRGDLRPCAAEHGCPRRPAGAPPPESISAIAGSHGRESHHRPHCWVVDPARRRRGPSCAVFPQGNGNVITVVSRSFPWSGFSCLAFARVLRQTHADGTPRQPKRLAGPCHSGTRCRFLGPGCGRDVDGMASFADQLAGHHCDQLCGSSSCGLVSEPVRPVMHES